MSPLLLFTLLLLCAVFLVAGLAKLADLAGSRQAVRNFNISTYLTSPFAYRVLVGLPIALGVRRLSR
jgi:uncharacterized membrane protein YphA (DoxX/SURF4 family)